MNTIFNLKQNLQPLDITHRPSVFKIKHKQITSQTTKDLLKKHIEKIKETREKKPNESLKYNVIVIDLSHEKTLEKTPPQEKGLDVEKKESDHDDYEHTKNILKEYLKNNEIEHNEHLIQDLEFLKEIKKSIENLKFRKSNQNSLITKKIVAYHLRTKKNDQAVGKKYSLQEILNTIEPLPSPSPYTYVAPSPKIAKTRPWEL